MELPDTFILLAIAALPLQDPLELFLQLLHFAAQLVYFAAQLLDDPVRVLGMRRSFAMLRMRRPLRIAASALAMLTDHAFHFTGKAFGRFMETGCVEVFNGNLQVPDSTL